LLLLLLLLSTEKAIPAGTQVLHTYGDLSDAQLLQTYGFIDTPPQPTQHQQQQQQQDDEQEEQEEARSDKDAAAAEPGAGGTQLTSNPHNYVVLQLDALLSAVKTVAAAAKVWPAKKAKQVRALTSMCRRGNVLGRRCKKQGNCKN